MSILIEVVNIIIGFQFGGIHLYLRVRIGQTSNIVYAN